MNSFKSHSVIGNIVYISMGFLCGVFFFCKKYGTGMTLLSSAYFRTMLLSDEVSGPNTIINPQLLVLFY